MNANGISRREFVLATGVLAAGHVISSASPALKHAVQVNSQGLAVAQREVSVMSSSHPLFLDRLDQLFPGFSQHPKFNMISPLTFLMKHVSGPPIKACSVVWSIVTADGSFETSSFYYSRSGRTNVISGRKHLLEAGNTALVSPFFHRRPQKPQSPFPDDWAQGLGGNESQSFLLRKVQRANRIFVQLDGVIYADSVVVGPDSKNLARHFAVRRNAEHDEAVSMLRFMGTGPTRAEIIGRLRQHKSIEGIRKGAASRSNADEHWYYHARTLQARTLLRYFQAHGQSSFQNTLAALAKQPKTRIVGISQYATGE